MKHIYLDKSFLFFLLIIIITGSFNDFLLYFSLLLIHEFGHSIVGILFGYKLDKISFYPYGGVTSFNMPLNIPLKRELLILIAGPFFQICGYLVLNIFFASDNFTTYHYTLLIFNLLPIYPLDGGRIINVLCNYKWSYLNSFYLSFGISLLILLGLFIYNIFHFNMNLFLLFVVLFIKLINNYRNLKHYYNRFLLERCLYDFNFNKIKYINSVDKFYRDRFHFVKLKKEKKFLKGYFKIN